MSVEQDLEKHEQEMAEWRAVIGKAIIGFGEVEMVTYKCVAHLAAIVNANAVSRQGFSKRVEAILKVLESHNKNPAEQRRAIELLRRAQELAQTRNDIAHNPVMLTVFENEVSGDFAFERCISSARDGRIIDLEQAKEFADEVESIAAELWLTLSKLLEQQPEVIVTARR